MISCIIIEFFKAGWSRTEQ